MPSVMDHYENLLARHYSWLQGGIAEKVEENRLFFATHGIAPTRTGIAIDLGSGSGFQAIPLARLGFRVIAIDLSPTLLSELRTHAGDMPIDTVHDDLLHFSRHWPGPADLCVCMGDTLTHLDSREAVSTLFQNVANCLEQSGTFILTFRDLSFELTGLDRFLPLRSEPDKIFTCFLEYEPEHVKVHDLIYERFNNQWLLHKSFYRKCRVPCSWAKETLLQCGFTLSVATVEKGFVTIIAHKRV